MRLKPLITGVCERDIDLLLLEEFISTDVFMQWFAQKVMGPRIDVAQVLTAKRSVTTSSGESDLEIAFTTSEGSHVRLLIENKINTSLQPLQAERYRERGEGYLGRKECSVYRTVIAAPERYFGSQDTTKGFDVKVSYETIRDWYIRRAGIGDRKHYKVALLDLAISKGVHGYQPIEDAPITQFFVAYWNLARQQAPGLAMNQPDSKPSGSDWVYFRSEQLPNGFRLCHKMKVGWVELQILGAGLRANHILNSVRQCLEDDMDIAATGKSAVIRVKVPSIDRSWTFHSQTAEVNEAIGSAAGLLDWYVEHRVQLSMDSRESPQLNG